MNPFLQLQERLAALLRAHAYFAPLPDDAIVTENIGDIDNKVQRDLLPLGFGVVITTAKGDAHGSLNALTTRETITVALIHNPTIEPEKNVLDALAAAVAAIHGQPVTEGARIRQEQEAWKVTGHERRTDTPAELHVHHLFVQAALKLS